MSLCVLQDVKDRLAITRPEHDNVLGHLIAAMGSRFDRYTGRKLQAPAADVTETYTGRSDLLQIERYPVISISSIKESYDYDFDNSTTLTADTDYRLIKSGRNGIIKRLYANWLNVDDGIQIVYRGGYIGAGDPFSPEAGEIPFPDDLREAAILQCTFVFQRRDDIGLSSISFDGGSMNKFSAIKLLPEVTAILNSYRRISV